jgi:hypothetical protein
MDFRPDFPCLELDFLRARAWNATMLLDLANFQAGYSPTAYQRGLFPAEFRDKISVCFDGIEVDLYLRFTSVLRPKPWNCRTSPYVG